jgi:hypothetical protein
MCGTKQRHIGGREVAHGNFDERVARTKFRRRRAALDKDEAQHLARVDRRREGHALPVPVIFDLELRRMAEGRLVGKIVGVLAIVGDAARGEVGGGARAYRDRAARGRLAHRDRRAGRERGERPEGEQQPHRLPPKR